MQTIDWFHFLMFQRIKIKFPRDPLMYKSGQSFFVQTALAVTLKKGPTKNSHNELQWSIFQIQEVSDTKISRRLTTALTMVAAPHMVAAPIMAVGTNYSSTQPQ